MANDTDQQTEAYRDIAAAHIRSLSALNARIPSILTASATSFSQLTNAPIHPPSANLSATAPDTLERRQDALSTSANAFFTSVLELSVALHAQIADLEKNGVIPAEEVKYRAPVQQAPSGAPGAGPSQQGHPQQRDSEATVTNGGLGDFDVGVLNARAGVRQKDGEEVLDRVKKVLGELAEHTEGNDDKMATDG